MGNRADVDVIGHEIRGRSRADVLRKLRRTAGVVNHTADVELDVTIRLPPDAERLVRRSIEARRRAHDAQREANDILIEALGTLIDSLKLSRRDAVQVLGLSHHRIQQLQKQSRTRTQPGR